jgi:hypothetical protein
VIVDQRVAVGTHVRPVSHRNWAADRVMWIVLGGLVATALVVHDIGYILSHPFWLDEAWVAVLSMLPVSELIDRASGVPIGWLLLMRLIPGDSEQRFRLLPLVLAVGSTVVAAILAYGLAWSRRWTARTAAVITGLAVTLSPAALVRNDLKQYTADAFMALLMLHLVGRLDQQWTRGRLAGLVSVAIAGAFLSSTSMFVSGAVLIAVLIIAIGTNGQQVRDAVVAGVVTGVALLAIGWLIVLPSISGNLYQYWEGFYLNLDVVATATETDVGSVAERLAEVFAAVGLGALSGVVLVALGLRSLVALHRPRMALGVVVLLAMMVGLAVVERYPFLDVRTWHFLLMVFVVVASVGIVQHITGMNAGSRWAPILIGVFTLGIVVTAWPHVRSESIAEEDVRAQIRHVESAWTAGDVLLVNLMGTPGLGYYWQGNESRLFVDDQTFSTGWMVRIDLDDIVHVEARTDRATTEALEEALTKANASDGRLWIVRTHVLKQELGFWNRAFSRLELDPVPIPVGLEPLLLVK